jgi:hypothetical protein
MYKNMYIKLHISIKSFNMYTYKLTFLSISSFAESIFFSAKYPVPNSTKTYINIYI